MLKKLLLGLVVVLVVLIGGGALWFTQTFPKAEKPPNLTVQSTPDKVARGGYLAEHVTMCIDCHSTRDWNYYAGPVKPGTEGQGGELFGENMGLPGDFYARNITPAGVGEWTDGELARTITSGVNKNGEALFPIMPYPHFARMTQADLEAVIAYIRTLKPVVNEVPKRSLKFPMNLIVNTIPQPRGEAPAPPDPDDSVARGRYLVTIAVCSECHTLSEKGVPLEGMDFAGGMEFGLPSNTVYSANITPDRETGIGAWSRETFVTRFKQYEGPAPEVGPEGLNTVMPWPSYAGMTEDDLGAIYDYLRTIKPVDHKVDKYEGVPER